jgi:hypothetical protein
LTGTLEAGTLSMHKSSSPLSVTKSPTKTKLKRIVEFL